MKILVVRIGKTIGGAEIYNLVLIRGFKKYFSKDKLFFITNLPELAKKIRNLGTQAFVFSGFSEEIGTKKDLLKLSFYLPFYLFNYLKCIFRLKKIEGIDLVCFQSATEKIVLTPFLKLLGLRVVWLEHGPFFAFPKTRIVLGLYKAMSCLADKIMVVSRDAKQDLIRNGIKRQKVVLIPTGIDTDYFSPLSKTQIAKMKKQLKIGIDENVVGYVGSISPKKGMDDWLQIASLVSQKNKKVDFILVGEGSMLVQLKSEIKKKGLADKFVFPGFQDDIRPYLGLFDLFLYPTRHLEGLSAAVIQAMAMEKPVIARDIGGNKELVNGKTGYLFKEETPEALADLIIKLLRDKQKRGKMGTLGRERALQNYSLKDWVTKLHSVFEDVVKDEER